MKKDIYCEPTSIRRHHIKFIRHCDLAPRSSARVL